MTYSPFTIETNDQPSYQLSRRQRDIMLAGLAFLAGLSLGRIFGRHEAKP